MRFKKQPKASVNEQLISDVIAVREVLRKLCENSGWSDECITLRRGVFRRRYDLAVVATGMLVQYHEGGPLKVWLAADGELYVWDNFYAFERVVLEDQSESYLECLRECLGKRVANWWAFGVKTPAS